MVVTTIGRLKRTLASLATGEGVTDVSLCPDPCGFLSLRKLSIATEPPNNLTCNYEKLKRNWIFDVGDRGGGGVETTTK